MIEPLVVIVPAYNSEPTLAKVVKDVRRNLPGAWVIGVDDGSTDGSRQLLKTVTDETIEFDKNRGKGAAFARDSTPHSRRVRQPCSRSTPMGSMTLRSPLRSWAHSIGLTSLLERETFRAKRFRSIVASPT